MSKQRRSGTQHKTQCAITRILTFREMREATEIYRRIETGRTGETRETAANKKGTRMKWILTKLIFHYWELRGRNREPLTLLLNAHEGGCWEYLTTPTQGKTPLETELEKMKQKRETEELKIKTEEDWTRRVELEWGENELKEVDIWNYIKDLEELETEKGIWGEEEKDEVEEIRMGMRTRKMKREMREKTEEDKREYYKKTIKEEEKIMEELEKGYGKKITTQHKEFYAWALIQPSMRKRNGKIATPYMIYGEVLGDLMEGKASLEKERPLRGKEIARLMETVNKKEISESIKRENQRERERDARDKKRKIKD